MKSSNLLAALAIVGAATRASHAFACAAGTALERALSTVTAGEIRADIEFLADDALRGRYTPSPELAIAARYLRARLERLGWRPGGREQSYFHTYQAEWKQIDAENSSISLGTGESAPLLVPGRDYYFPSQGDAVGGTWNGELVFCGDGEGSEDFSGAELAGRWALIQATPEDVAAARRSAGKAGALGLVVVPAAGADGSVWSARYAAVAQRLLDGRASYRAPKKPEAEKPRVEPEAERAVAAGGDERFLPALLLEPWAGAELWRAAGKPAGAALSAGEVLALPFSERRAVTGEGKVTLENVVGVWPGDDPVLADEVIIVSAHYDHVGVQRGEIHNGADDNGSGTAALLAVAEALAEFGPMHRTVMLIWVSGEERGLWGSAAFAADPVLPDGARAYCNLNIDMVGRNAPDKLLVTPTRQHPSHNGIVVAAETLAPLEGFPVLGSADDYYHRSDHMNFEKLGIPVAFLFSDVHEDYHQPGDDVEKIDCDKVRRVARLSLRLIDVLQAPDALR